MSDLLADEGLDPGLEVVFGFVNFDWNAVEDVPSTWLWLHLISLRALEVFFGSIGVLWIVGLHQVGMARFWRPALRRLCLSSTPENNVKLIHVRIGLADLDDS